MTFENIRDQVIALLQQHGRVSHQSLKALCNLDKIAWHAMLMTRMIRNRSCHAVFSLWVLMLLVMLVGAVPFRAYAGETVERVREKIVLNVTDLSPDLAAQLADKLADERRKVRTWWGQTFEDTIRVDMSPTYRITKALIPAWRGDRGRMEHPTRRPLQRGTLHELVHIYAPNGNRFLAEGLAVYAQHVMGNNPAYPNYGESLHALVWHYWPSADILALESIHTPKRLQLNDRLNGQGAYLVAGSFVSYLIEKQGLPTFRKLYDMTPLLPGDREAGGRPTRWESVYGMTLAALANGWRAFIEQRAPVDTTQSRGLDGDGIRRLLAGNTLEVDRTVWGSDKLMRFWLYYLDDGTFVGRNAKGFIKGTNKWRVTPGGMFCRMSIIFGEQCWTNVRIEAEMVTMEGLGKTPNLTATLLKGNPHGL